MFTAFSIFRIFNLLYQIIATFFVYGLNLFLSSSIALFREGIRILFLLIIFFCNLKHFKPYRQKRKQTRITFIILIVISVLLSLFISHSSLSNIFIGIKYGFRWMFVLLTAGFLGYVGSEKLQKYKGLKILPRILVGIALFGFVFQGAKLLRPDFFYSIGYGGLDDYAYGENPPIYYLTSFEGTLRRQGLFSGPNNYGYFLIAFLPLVRCFFTTNIGEKKYPIGLNIGALVVRFSAMVFTLSRAVIVGMVVVFGTMYRNRLKNNKKLLIGGGIGVLIVLVVLSILKRESTLGHITSKIDVLPEIFSHPLGYGLGSSGPAVHYEGKFLPENYYFQIMLDIGTVGFLVRVTAMFYMMRIQYKTTKSFSGKISERDEYQLNLLHKMQVGLFALMVMGLFLHVFEDSMVNYLFFTVYGIVLGSLSKNLKGDLGWKIKLDKKK